MNNTTPWWEHLKARRLELGISRYALAKTTNLSHPYIMKLEKGAVKEPSYAKLSLIASALGVSVADIFEDKKGEGQESNGRGVDDPHVREIQANVLAIKELSPQSFEAVKRVVTALKREAEEDAKAIRREEQRARRKLQPDRRSGK